MMYVKCVCLVFDYSQSIINDVLVTCDQIVACEIMKKFLKHIMVRQLFEVQYSCTSLYGYIVEIYRQLLNYVV